MIATGQLVGGGFDFPRLDTLLMAIPVAWKGVVEQYAGRLNRDYAGKEDVLIYDYVDAHIPVFERMYAKRLKAYKRIGYSLCVTTPQETQSVNAIFDADNYRTVYENDLQNARFDVVISSPALRTDKVSRIINLLKASMEAGLKATIVTWHPSASLYGNEGHRIELLETLRNAGFHLELAEDNSQRYAIIDKTIVWYGSMNLLAKEDVEDCIMRLESKDIAAELMEMSFGREKNLQEYQLPL